MMDMLHTNPEVLAPAGSFEAAVAAVRAGAGAVYLGAKSLSARAFAQNFSFQELSDIVFYCHARGVRVYLTVNTLLTDGDFPCAIQTIQQACVLPVDALIVQDMGLVRMIRQICPSMPLHASTQMSVHTPGGAKLLYEMGFKRVVLARELSVQEIEQIAKSCPVELEVFIHGALCMSVSGQCYLSAMLGGRSGNRGRCAQPCRLPFYVKGGTGHDLSLKDLSLLSHLHALARLGVCSFKIEGRMKRPEYVYSAVSAAQNTLRRGKTAPEERKRLQDVFSRSGFTDAYYTGRRTPAMFGIRSKNDVTAATEKLLSAIRAQYKDELQNIPVCFRLSVQPDKEALLTVSDNTGHTAVAKGEVPQQARRLPLSPDICTTQLKKTGGTPFFCAEVSCKIGQGLSMPAAALNRMRRLALDKLLQERAKRTAVPCACVQYKTQAPHTASAAPAVRARFADTDIPDCFRACQWIYVPLFSPPDQLRRLIENGFPIAVEIPRGMFGSEAQVEKQLKLARDCGVTHALVNNIGAIHLAARQGFALHGGFGLNLMNTQSLDWAQETGLCDTELSFELTARQIGALGGKIKRGILAYGRLPLMLTRNCPQKNARVSCKACGGKSCLTDRKKQRFPIQCAYTCTEILNSVALCLFDCLDRFSGIDFFVLRFSVENHVEKEESFYAFQERKHLDKAITRGLYFRGVQ